jgi:hypothetical protein
VTTPPERIGPGRIGPPPDEIDFRCSVASERTEEPLAGTAPDEPWWLLVEYAGPWGRKAVAESRLDDEVRAHLAALDDVRVQLVRRHGGASTAGTRVFAVDLGVDPAVEPVVRTTVLEDPSMIPSLDPAAMTPYDGPLWLVCTNGRRDLCCAERGRPVAAVLAARWPDATWETTHLGGHRFSGTLVALPSGLTLGRLTPDSAVAACHEIESGRVPVRWLRGRAGLPGAAQVAEVHVRSTLGLTGLDEVAVSGVERADDGASAVTVRTPTGDRVVVVDTTPGVPRRQSCGDLRTKAAAVHTVRL